MNGLLDLAGRLGGATVVVLGEALLDGWLSGGSVRLSREAPVQVVDVAGREYAPGGAANTAVNLAALGAAVRLVSVVGDDADGDLLAALLTDAGVGLDHLTCVPGRRTLAKRRITAGGQMLLRVDDGDTSRLRNHDEQHLLALLADAAAGADAVVVSDYGLGLLGPAAVDAVAALSPRLLVLDAREPARWAAARPTVVKPNAAEVLALVGPPVLDLTSPAPWPADLPEEPARVRHVTDRGADVLAACGAELALVTLDADGAVLLERDRPAHRVWPHGPAAPAGQAAGAGDCVTAVLTLALVAGGDAPQAAELAMAAAGVVVGQPGTTACSVAELQAAVLELSGPALDLDQVRHAVSAHRLRGRRLVFTNGCFDVLHRGHVSYLNAAKALGDVLVVGVNSDASARRLKGAGRPVNAAEDRAAVLAGLSCVDHVVIFDGDTPADVLDVVRPEVYAKGGDYSADRLAEAPLVESLGGRVVILPYLEDHSTTSVLRRIRRD